MLTDSVPEKEIPLVNEEPPRLARKITHGAFWLFSFRIASRLLSTVSSIVLARLLSPSDFGILGTAMLAIGFLETFTQIGFEGALIQKNASIERFLDTAWLIAVLRGLVIGALLFAAAPLVAQFFDSPQSALVLKVLAMVPVLSGITSIGIVTFRKELDFNKIFAYQLSELVVNVSISVWLAYAWGNVWALVYGILAGRSVSVVISYLIHPYRPGLRFDLHRALDLFAFGKWLLGAQIVKYFINRGDNVFVGKMLGATSLGFYAMAYNISNIPVLETTNVVSQVMFPAYSKIQNNKPKLQVAYLRVIEISAFFAIPLAGMIFCFSNDFTRLVLGEKWLPIVPIIKVFALQGLICSISASTGPYFQAIGKPKIVTQLIALRLIIIACLIYPLTKALGMQGTALAVLASAIVIDPFAIYLVSRINKNSIIELSKIIVIPFLNTAAMVSIVYIVRTFLANSYGLFGMSFLASLGIITYFLSSYLCEKCCGYSAMTVMRQTVAGPASCRVK